MCLYPEGVPESRFPCPFRAFLITMIFPGPLAQAGFRHPFRTNPGANNPQLRIRSLHTTQDCRVAEIILRPPRRLFVVEPRSRLIMQATAATTNKHKFTQI